MPLVIRRRFSIICLLSLTGACGGVHLGPGVGRTVRSAFQAQAERSGPALAPLDSADAKRVVIRRHNGGTPAATGISAAPAIVPTSSAPGGDMNTNPIRLDAK
jgi:hypothetical protein